MKKIRTSTGKSGEAVLKEYNHRCSVCGADRPQLHHIDENPSNQDPLNLLPLCPNCHLSDHHNPTARIEPRLLRLFRFYKDPTILSPQFVPLFQRLLYLEDVSIAPLEQLIDKGDELIGFVSQLEMGSFYASQIGERLKAPSSPEIYILPESDESRRRREERRERQLEDYRCQVAANLDDIHRLAIEMLRYQHWRHDSMNAKSTA